MRQIKEASNEISARELYGLDERMQIKGNHITNLRRLHDTVSSHELALTTEW